MSSGTAMDEVLESCGDGVLYLDPAGRILAVNESFAAMLGRTRDELVGTLLLELGPMLGEFPCSSGETIRLDRSCCDFLAQLPGEMDALLAAGSGRIENRELFPLHRDGYVVPVELTLALRRDAGSRVTGTVAFVRNLTRRHAAERAIRGATEFLQKVIEASYDGIIVSDIDGCIILSNSAIERLVGCEKHELVGRRFSEVVAVDHAAAEITAPRLADLRSRGKLSFETDFNTPAGDTICLEHGITLIPDEDGAGGYIVSIIRDITDKKESARQLQEAHRFRSRFFTDITHAFRTPLTLAIGPVEGVLRGEFGPVGKKIADQLGLSLRNSRQLLKLINQLLDFSRIESGSRDMVFVEKDLQQFVGAVVDSFSFLARKKKITLSLEPGTDIPCVSVDPVKTEKALYNLLGNAFKFTPEGGSITVMLGHDPDGAAVPLEVRTRGSAPGETPCGYVKISVADTGAGIRPEDHEAIFDRFQQADTGPARSGSGAGIGLAHTREILSLMGGHITVTSAVGEGSTFSMYLPVRSAPGDSPGAASDELCLDAAVELADVVTDGEPLQDSAATGKPLIMVLDDNPDVRRYIASILSPEYDYILAASGSEGLQKLQKQVPELILCDIMMPDGDGHAFLKRVKADPGLQHIPVVFLTARADTEMKIEGLDEGADDYIVKPFNSLELLARIRSLLRMRALAEQTALQQRTIDRLTRTIEGTCSYGNIIGASPAMRRVYQLLESISQSPSTVLITGETGTGKELVAGAIHYNSPRKRGPLVSVNCGAIPKDLMEREFFGHVRGAYTGAVTSRKGYFAEADRGTLFLDEIAEMSPDMQVKLLRVLERGEVLRVGETVPTAVDVRLIAATNRNLQAEVRAGRFREDLFYRIHVFPVHLPPLRDRAEDIPLLIDHFLETMRGKLGRDVPAVPSRDMRLFMNHTYPGNVRELQNAVERYCLMGGSVENLFGVAPSGAAQPETAFPYEALLSTDNPLKAAGQKARLQAEKEIIMHVLQLCDNDYSQAAAMLNIGLSSLYRKLKEVQ